MHEHFIIAVDRGRLRIFAERPVDRGLAPRLEVVESVEFPAAAPRDTTGAEDGGSEGLHRTDVLTAEVDAFLRERPLASWDFAGMPGLYDLIVERLAPEARRRLKRAWSADVFDRNAEDVRVHFAQAEI
jgi:hypothetical protein